MLPSRPLLVILNLSCGMVSAAALVPLQVLKSPLPVAGLEVNRGQAKPEILFLSRGISPVAVTAQSIVYSPLGVRQNFVASNPNPEVRFFDPIPGVANALTGADPLKWVIGIPRYATARLSEVYPGIDAERTESLCRFCLPRTGNVILPYSLPVGALPNIQVETQGSLGNELGGIRVQTAGISLFRVATDAPERRGSADSWRADVDCRVCRGCTGAGGRSQANQCQVAERDSSGRGLSARSGAVGRSDARAYVLSGLCNHCREP
jgi:hypothetical protein